MTTSETPTISFEGAVIVLRVLQLIPKHGWTTAREIREILDADGIRLETRTMQRILKTLREHPEIFPLETELEGRTLRYRWSPSAKGFHLPVLSPQDMLLLRLAEEHLLFQLPSSVLAGLRPLFREARQLSSTAPHVKRECSWLQKVKVVSPALSFMPPRIRPLVFENVTQALSFGCEVQKFFPAEPIGPAVLTASLAAFSHKHNLKVIAAGGITPENIGRWLAVPHVIACGASWICPQEMIEAEDWNGIADRVRQMHAAAAHAVASAAPAAPAA